jgi:sulfatase modifying factor 1
MLRKLVNNTDRKLGLMAFGALTALGRADGIAQPVTGEPPGIFVSPIDGAEMVPVPAGPFLYGSREDDKVASSDEKPQRVIDLPSFYVDKYPVTNSQYCMFLNQRRPSEKQLKEWMELSGEKQGIIPIQERAVWTIQRKREVKGGDAYKVKKGYDKHPVTYVTWHGAAAYAEWAEKRLPTEQEWEKAARGTDGRIYPWGNEFDAGRCNTSESRIGTTTPVDRYKTGESSHGCYDMAGNVWEWTDSWYDEGRLLKVIRGGSWAIGHAYARCAGRVRFNPGIRSNFSGFRCARTKI